MTRIRMNWLIPGLLFAFLIIWAINDLFFAKSGLFIAEEVLRSTTALNPTFSFVPDPGEILAGLDSARKIMYEVNDRDTWFARASKLCVWLAFAATSAITLVSAFYGKSTGGGAPEISQSQGVPTKATRWITFLAALGASLTAASNMTGTAAQEDFALADHMLNRIEETRSKLMLVTDQDNARHILDELNLYLKRLY